MSAPTESASGHIPPRCIAELVFIFAAGAWGLPSGCFFLLRRCGYRVSAAELPYWLLGFTVLSAAAGVFYLFLRGIPLKPLFGPFPRRKQEWLTLLRLFVLLLAGSAGVSRIWKLLLDYFAVPYTEQQPLLALAGTFSPFALAALFLAAAVLTPFHEELLFRKLLFDWFRPAGLMTAWIGTAAIFSAVHLFLFGIPGLFVMGLIFQYACRKTGSLWSSILLHGFANAAALGAALLQSRL